MNGMILSIIILILVVFSVRERMRQRMFREKDWSVIGESKSSPLSEALTNLIGVAGGIYLSLEVLMIFADVELPERVQFAGLSLEPLAALSILMALAQPFFYRVVNAWRRI